MSKLYKKELLEVILEASGKLIDRLMARTSFTGRFVFVVGAVIINSDWEIGSFLELRRFDCYDINTKEKLTSHLHEFSTSSRG